MDQVELALNTLYQPNFGAGQKEAERFLVDYQKNPNSWPNSLNLLSTSSSQTVQFFAAQSLYTNLHRDWYSNFNLGIILELKDGSKLVS